MSITFSRYEKEPAAGFSLPILQRKKRLPQTINPNSITSSLRLKMKARLLGCGNARPAKKLSMPIRLTK